MQGDLLAALYGQPGDTPTIVMAPSSIEECFHFVITARKLTVVQSDAPIDEQVEITWRAPDRAERSRS